jgi:hypothetical protein
MKNSFLTTALALVVAVVIAAAGYGLGAKNSARAVGCFAERAGYQREKCIREGTAACLRDTQWVDENGNTGYDREKLEVCINIVGGGKVPVTETRPVAGDDSQGAKHGASFTK